MDSIETWGESTRFYFPQGIRWWPVINLVTLVDGYSHFISLEIVVGYWKLRSFQKTLVNLNGLLKKPDITYQSRNSYNGISWAKLWNYSKDLGPFWKYFIWVGTTIFSKIHQDRFSYDRSNTFLINWQGRHKLEPGRHFQQNYQLSPGHRGASHRGTWIERCNSGHF